VDGTIGAAFVAYEAGAAAGPDAVVSAALAGAIAPDPSAPTDAPVATAPTASAPPFKRSLRLLGFESIGFLLETGPVITLNENGLPWNYTRPA
jgi:hypothetical protein